MNTLALVLLGLAALVLLGRCITTDVARTWWGHNPTDDSQGTDCK